MTESIHSGRSVQLRSGQQEDGTWICEYTIIELGRPQSKGVTRAHQSSFSTREEAEAAAMDAAQAEIDSRGPLT